MSGQLTITQLEQKANEVRKDIIRMLVAAGSGHSAGPLDLAEIVTTLYFDVMNIRPEEPEWSERDYFFLSNGHCVPVQYAVMAERGYFPREELTTLRKLGSRLQGHPERKLLPGLENTSGPLGSGLSQAAGVAHVLQYIDHQPHRFVYVVTGDGELNEGNIWEAAMFAGFRKLDNLVVIVDNNGLQIDGPVDQVNSPYPIDKKFEAFNFHVIRIDAHDFDQIRDALKEARETKGMPTAIIMHSIKGKGVSFMENQVSWHGKAPNDEEYATAMADLERIGEQL